MRAHLALIGLAATTALSGCAGAPSVPATAAPAPVSGSPSPYRVIHLAVPKATSPAPALANTGTSWMPILTSLSAYGQWLLANPNPNLIGTIATPGCPVANMLDEQVTGLLNSNTYVKTSPAVITSVAAPSPAPATTPGSQVTMDIIASRPAEPVLSRTATKTISTFAAYPQSTFQVTLDLGADRRWRFCALEAATDEGAPDDPSVPLI